jgi:hypothetical protein
MRALRRIAIYKAVADQAPVTRIFEDGACGAEPPRIVRSLEEDQRHDQNRRTDAVLLGKRMAFLVPSSGHHLFVDAVTLAHRTLVQVMTLE